MQFRELKIMPGPPHHRTVEVVYSDQADPAQAKNYLRFRSLQPAEPRTSALIFHEGVLSDLHNWLRTEMTRIVQATD